MTDRQTDRQTQTGQYYVVDWIKLLAAICVIVIHTCRKKLTDMYFGNYAIDLLNYVVSLAVPFFFCVSGYFLYKKITQIGEREKILKQTRRKYFRLYLIFSAVYLPISAYAWLGEYYRGDGILKIGIRALKNYILVGEQPYSWPLWYLLAMIYGVSVLLKSKDDNKVMIAESVIFFIVAIILNHFSSIKMIAWFLGSGRLFTAPAYLLVGGLIYKNQEKLEKHIGIGFALICIAVVFSLIFHLDYSTASIPAYISIPWILSWTMNFKGISKRALIARKVSTIFYYSHMYFFFIWLFAGSAFIRFEETRDSGIGAFCFTLISCVILSGIFLGFEKHKTVKA